MSGRERERAIRVVETYERFHRHIAAWVDREVPCLIVFGPPGTGKSSSYRTALGNRKYHLFGGRQTPLHVYITLHDAPHLPVVLDDISALLRDDQFRDMLKGLCDTGKRVVRWGTTTARLEGRPTSFTCTCPVLIVLNRMPARDPDLEAILDRCDAIRFEPTKIEVIAKMHALFPFPEDGDLIDLLAELPAMPSLRTLIKARQWKASKNLNLIEELLAECGVPEPVQHLVQIMEAFPESEWCARFTSSTHMTDRTYRRHKLMAEQLLACRKSPKPCPSVHATPPPVDSAGELPSPGEPGRHVRVDPDPPAAGA